MRGTNSSVETDVYYTPGRKLKRTLTNQMRCIRKYNRGNFFRRTGRASIAEDERFPALLRLGRGGCIIDNVVSIDREYSGKYTDEISPISIPLYRCAQESVLLLR